MILFNVKTNIETIDYQKILLLISIYIEFFLNIEKQVNIVYRLLKNIVSRYLLTIRYIFINISLLANSIVRLLISYSILIDTINKKRKTTLYYIARSRNYKIFRILFVCNTNKRIRN